MITYKPIIIPGGRRKDGIWPVKIRVTFKGVSRRIPTTLACTDTDLTRSGKIKNAAILERAGELIARMREATADLSPFTLEAWSVDEVVAHIRAALSADSFRLDFFAYGRELIAGKIPHTRAYYQTALNALADYLGRDTLDINSITRGMLVSFAESVGETKAARHLAKLAFIHRSARDQFNDEDAGAIRIPRQPFQNLPKVRPQGKGQKALQPQELQALIDCTPANEWEALALAAFLLSFCTMGANLADLYAEKGPISGVWCYKRRKTGVYNEVSVNARIAGLAGQLQDGPAGWWLPALHRYGTADTATHNINKWLAQIAARLGLPSFRFYAARKTWATTARRLGIEKATIDDALAHAGNYRMADIYAEKNWTLTAAANERVQAEFRWPPDNYATKTEDTDGK
jgi:integrase